MTIEKDRLTEAAKPKPIPGPKREKVDIEDIQILGVAKNFNGDGRDYYVAYDGKRYFIFLGNSCQKVDDFWDYGDM